MRIRNLTNERLTKARRGCFAAILLGLALSACADAFATLGDSLDAVDRQKIVSSTIAALESNKTGESTNWENPANGHRGTVTPTRTFKSRLGADCREFRQTVAIGQSSTTAHDTACRDRNGAWYSVEYGALDSAIALTGPNSTSYGYRYDDPFYDPHYGYYDPYWDPFYWHHYPHFGHPYHHHPRYHGSRVGIRFGYGHFFH